MFRSMAVAVPLATWLPAVCSALVTAVACGLAHRFRAGRRAARPGPLGEFVASRRDPLTRLAGRAAFLDGLSTRLVLAEPMALLVIDLDCFAEINASHGLRAGDEVLQTVGDRLRRLSQGAEAAARLDGDQFGLLVPAPRGVEDAEAAALAVLRSLLQPIACGARQVDCTVSLGVAMLPEQGADADRALRAACAALSRVKAAGGAAWRFFDPDRGEADRQRAALADELRAAVANGAILPVYQPIVDLADGGMVGLEVLARWHHPTRGLLPPDIFIPLAEEMGLTGQITQTLMRRVISDARDWPAWLYFAFNVSPGQLRELIGMVRNPPSWPEGTLDPRRMEVEVTESALIEDVAVAREVIALLQARGTRVVLDDFGIGLSNFFHLRELPFDRIKIDRSFIMDIATDPRAEACVRAMLALGRSLGIPMVAEGVESARTEALLVELGCRFGQGFIYSEAVSAFEVHALVRRMTGRGREAVQAEEGKAFFSGEKKQKTSGGAVAASFTSTGAD